MKIVIAVLFVQVVVSRPVCAQEVRGGVSLGYDLSSKINVEIELEGRGLLYPDLFYNRVSLGKVEYSINKFWQVSGTYSYSSLFTRSASIGEIESENSERHKITGNLVFKSIRFDNDIKLKNRVRYQYATTDDKKPKEYLRNKLALEYRISKGMQPYFAVEPYYSLNKNYLRFLRFYIGDEIAINKAKFELYFITELDLKERYTTSAYILGATCQLNFKKE